MEVHQDLASFVEQITQCKDVQELCREAYRYSCHQGVRLIRNVRVTNLPNKVELAEILTNAYLLRDLTVSTSFCCTKELMSMWCELYYELGLTVDEIGVEASHLINNYATTSAHFYLFVDVLYSCLGSSLLPVYLDMYIRGLNYDINLREKALFDDNADSISELYAHIAFILTKLALLLKDMPTVARECILSAFALNPTKERLEALNRFTTDINRMKSFEEKELNCKCGGTCFSEEEAHDGRPEYELRLCHGILDCQIKGVTYDLLKDLVTVVESVRSKHVTLTSDWQSYLNCSCAHRKFYLCQCAIGQDLHSDSESSVINDSDVYYSSSSMSDKEQCFKNKRKHLGKHKHHKGKKKKSRLHLEDGQETKEQPPSNQQHKCSEEAFKVLCDHEKKKVATLNLNPDVILQDPKTVPNLVSQTNYVSQLEGLAGIVSDTIKNTMQNSHLVQFRRFCTGQKRKKSEKLLKILQRPTRVKIIKRAANGHLNGSCPSSGTANPTELSLKTASQIAMKHLGATLQEIQMERHHDSAAAVASLVSTKTSAKSCTADCVGQCTCKSVLSSVDDDVVASQTGSCLSDTVNNSDVSPADNNTENNAADSLIKSSVDPLLSAAGCLQKNSDHVNKGSVAQNSVSSPVIINSEPRHSQNSMATTGPVICNTSRSSTSHAQMISFLRTALENHRGTSQNVSGIHRNAISPMPLTVSVQNVSTVNNVSSGEVAHNKILLNQNTKSVKYPSEVAQKEGVSVQRIVCSKPEASPTTPISSLQMPRLDNTCNPTGLSTIPASSNSNATLLSVNLGSSIPSVNKVCLQQYASQTTPSYSVVPPETMVAKVAIPRSIKIPANVASQQVKTSNLVRNPVYLPIAPEKAIPQPKPRAAILQAPFSIQSSAPRAASAMLLSTTFSNNASHMQGKPIDLVNMRDTKVVLRFPASTSTIPPVVSVSSSQNIMQTSSQITTSLASLPGTPAILKANVPVVSSELNNAIQTVQPVLRGQSVQTQRPSLLAVSNANPQSKAPTVAVPVGDFKGVSLPANFVPYNLVVPVTSVVGNQTRLTLKPSIVTVNPQNLKAPVVATTKDGDGHNPKISLGQTKTWMTVRDKYGKLQYRKAIISSKKPPEKETSTSVKSSAEKGSSSVQSLPSSSKTVEQAFHHTTAERFVQNDLKRATIPVSSSDVGGSVHISQVRSIKLAASGPVRENETTQVSINTNTKCSGEKEAIERVSSLKHASKNPETLQNSSLEARSYHVPQTTTSGNSSRSSVISTSSSCDTSHDFSKDISTSDSLASGKPELVYSQHISSSQDHRFHELENAHDSRSSITEVSKNLVQSLYASGSLVEEVLFSSILEDEHTDCTDSMQHCQNVNSNKLTSTTSRPESDFTEIQLSLLDDTNSPINQSVDAELDQNEHETSTDLLTNDHSYSC